MGSYAKLKLYETIPNFSAENLFYIEGISNFLTWAVSKFNLTTVTFDNIQYQKPDLELNLKLSLSQTFSSPLKEVSYSYASLENQDATGKIFYYWIKKIEWKSENCIEVQMVMDVLNTFRIGTHYTFNPKTMINRQHESRYVKDFYCRKSSTTATTLNNPDDWIDNRIYHINMDPADYDQYIHSLGFSDDTTTIYVFKNNMTLFYGKIDYLKTTPYGEKWDIVIDEEEDIHKYFEDNVDIYISTNDNIVSVTDDPIKSAILCNNIDEYITVNETQNYNRKIDIVSEEINPVLYSEGFSVLRKSFEPFNAWFLVYDTNNDDDSVVDCYLVPEKATKVNVQSLSLTGGIIAPENLLEEVNYYIALEAGTGTTPFPPIIAGTQYGYNKFKQSNNDPICTTQVGTTLILQLKRDGNKILGSCIQFYDDTMNYQTHIIAKNSFITDYVEYIGTETHIDYGTSATDLSMESDYNYANISASWLTGHSFGTDSLRLLSPLKNMDKSKSTLLKIIRLPYCPYDFEITQDNDDNDIYSIDSKWTIESWNGLTNVLKLGDLTTEFSVKNLDQYLYEYDEDDNLVRDSEWDPLSMYGMRVSQSFINGLSLSERNPILESKLYNSEFFNAKHFYDSFSIPLNYAFIDFSKMKEGDYFNINFEMTRTINSRFAFETEYPTFTRDNDYFKWLIIQRNNEEVIYNSAYLNYIRVGYNYDVKNKDMNNAVNWGMAGASIAGTIASIVSVVASQGATLPLAVASITGTIATATTLTNAITSTVSNERSLQQKIDQLKQQTAGVSGADDVDLMEKYGYNRLLFVAYKPSERVSDMVYSLFYYYGYKRNFQGIPNWNNRRYWDYLQCEPVLNFKKGNISQACKNELLNIMKNGFTIIHYTDSKWNIEQEGENLENDIYHS